jgi:lysophospholipase L1-like esterase
MRERRREMGFALLLLVGGIFGIATAELAARSMLANRAANQMDWSAMRKAIGATPSGPFEFRPGTSFGQIRINAQGWRGPAVAMPKPAGVIRILFVGDSKLFAAELAERDGPAELTLARLKDRHPRCQFDYVNMSGPRYTLPFLTRKMRDQMPQIQASAVVLLVGSPIDLMSEANLPNPARTDSAPAVAPLPAKSGPIAKWLAGSDAVNLFGKELQMISPGTQPGSAARQSMDDLRSNYRHMLAELQQVIGSTPALSIEYRSQNDDRHGLAAQLLVGRQLRRRYPGITAEKAQAIKELVATEIQSTAAAAGWRYIDPIAAIADNQRYFLDRTHFSAAGNAHIAQAVSHEISSSITADCQMTTLARTSGKM